MLRITNTSGKTGPAWDQTYETVEAAALAIRHEMGWDNWHVGDAVEDTDADGHHCSARAVYESEETEGDARWAYAPKIVRG